MSFTNVFQLECRDNGGEQQ